MTELDASRNFNLASVGTTHRDSHHYGDDARCLLPLELVWMLPTRSSPQNL